jgi:hypothetical protein
MANYIRYTCASDMLPIVETALALNGYRVEIPRQRSIGGASALVMSQGLNSILLAADPASELGLIEVWGVPQSAAAQLLESLPIDLVKQSFG